MKIDSYKVVLQFVSTEIYFYWSLNFDIFIFWFFWVRLQTPKFWHTKSIFYEEPQWDVQTIPDSRDQPNSAKRTCNNRHSLVQFSFTNKVTPNFWHLTGNYSQQTFYVCTVHFTPCTRNIGVNLLAQKLPAQFHQHSAKVEK